MAGAILPDSTIIAYSYDVDGRRVQQDEDGTITNYVWDETSMYGDVILEYGATGTPIVDYTLADGQLLAQTRSTDPSYYLTDAQGSTRALANSSGTITDTYDYTAFGELYASTGSTVNSYLYTGQQFDSLAGLYSLRARYYGPTIGRFLSQDSFPVNYGNPIEINRYGYTANNPINGYDPSGKNNAETATLTALGGLTAIVALVALTPSLSGNYEEVVQALKSINIDLSDLDIGSGGSSSGTEGGVGGTTTSSDGTTGVGGSTGSTVEDAFDTFQAPDIEFGASGPTGPYTKTLVDGGSGPFNIPGADGTTQTPPYVFGMGGYAGPPPFELGGMGDIIQVPGLELPGISIDDTFLTIDLPLPQGIHNDLKYYFDTYPSTSFMCQQCAAGVSHILQNDVAEGYFKSVEVIDIRRIGRDFIADADGNVISDTGLHQVVKITLPDNNVFYIDSLVYEHYGLRAVDRATYLDLLGSGAERLLDFPGD